MQFRKIAFAICGFIILTGCGATIYESPDFLGYKHKHKNIALVPFSVSIDPRNSGKDVSEEQLEKLEVQQGLNFQSTLFNQFLQRQQKGQYLVEFQDIQKTNILLKRHLDTTGQDIETTTTEELCKIIGVDAVVSGRMVLSKPMGQVAAIAAALIFDVGVRTNEGKIFMTIHECEEGKFIWGYEYEVGGGFLSSPDKLVKELFKGVAKTFPYRRI